jgi:hypothetical protein
MKRLLAPAALFFAFALPLTAPAFAAGPPSGALPLSEIIRSFEETGEVAYFDEIEWDDDGYWEIEYRRTDGATVEVKVDPLTGEPRR